MVVHAAVDNDGHNFGACASSEFQESGHFRFCRAMLIVFFKCGWQQGFLKTSFRPCDLPIYPRGWFKAKAVMTGLGPFF